MFFGGKEKPNGLLEKGCLDVRCAKLANSYPGSEPTNTMDNSAERENPSTILVHESPGVPYAFFQDPYG